MDFWRVSGPFPGPGPLQDDRAHRDGDFAQGPVSVAWKVSENEPFEVFNENFWKLLINHPAWTCPGGPGGPSTGPKAPTKELLRRVL